MKTWLFVLTNKNAFGINVYFRILFLLFPFEKSIFIFIALSNLRLAKKKK
jgi:hypothetical protein